MGIVPGETIRVVKSAPFGDPMEIKVRGYHLAVRRTEANMIEINDAA
jgi:Fe2+ transport system protein FeoA